MVADYACDCFTIHPSSYFSANLRMQILCGQISLKTVRNVYFILAKVNHTFWSEPLHLLLFKSFSKLKKKKKLNLGLNCSYQRTAFKLQPSLGKCELDTAASATKLPAETAPRWLRSGHVLFSCLDCLIYDLVESSAGAICKTQQVDWPNFYRFQLVIWDHIDMLRKSWWTNYDLHHSYPFGTSVSIFLLYSSKILFCSRFPPSE